MDAVVCPGDLTNMPTELGVATPKDVNELYLSKAGEVLTALAEISPLFYWVRPPSFLRPFFPRDSSPQSRS